jgi:hypothetical protein
MFKDCDRWNKPDETGFNKTGYVTRNGVVIYPKRRQIAKTSLQKVERRQHRLFSIAGHPRADQIEIFFSNNVINFYLYHSAMAQIRQSESQFWDHPIKVPILLPTVPTEYESRWARLSTILRKGDHIFTLDTNSVASKLIAYLDQGTWSHVGCYVGEGRIVEAITSGVVERSIEAYHRPRYRLGVYRVDSAKPEQIEAMVSFQRTQIGKRYGWTQLFRLGAQLVFGVFPREVLTPNELIPAFGHRLIEIV